MSSSPITSSKSTTVEIVRRSLLQPEPGFAEPRHEYTRVFHTRAQVKTRTGAAEWAQVDIDGEKATHTFTIRYTTIPFDVRDRVRSLGQLFRILSVENVDMQDLEFRLHCASVGDESVGAAL